MGVWYSTQEISEESLQISESDLYDKWADLCMENIHKSRKCCHTKTRGNKNENLLCNCSCHTILTKTGEISNCKKCLTEDLADCELTGEIVTNELKYCNCKRKWSICDKHSTQLKRANL